MTGRTILHYRLTEKLGSGSMGVVWKALDTRLDREVALKFLPETATAEASRRERFFREAKAASALNHPNIVTIYEINSDDDQLFIAMELVRGQSLSDMLRARKRLPPRLVVDYAIQLCEGLGAAHRAGIVHRDIKPSNVMVSQDGMIKILDFGLAKLWAPESESAMASSGPPLTMAGSVVGTPPYMSPEQAVGGSVGPRSDVFSAGTVLYELLSGRRPFRGSSNSDIMRALIASDPEPLFSITDLPEPLAHIVHKCLNKNAEDRYGDASEIAAALRTLDRRAEPSGLSDQSTQTMVAQAPVPTPSWIRRGLLAGAAAVLAILLLAAYIWWPGRSGAVASAETLKTAQAYLQRYDKKGNVDKAIATLEPALGPAASGAALRPVLAEAYVRKYNETLDKQWLEKATKAAHQAVDANDDLATAHVALGMALAASGHSPEAAAQFNRAIQLNSLGGPAHLGLARLGSGPEAEQLYLKAIEYSPGDWIPVAELALFLYRDARYEESIAAWRQALQLASDNVTVMRNLAAALHMKGQSAEAGDTLQRALQFAQDNPAIFANLGTMRYFQGAYAESVRAFEKAVSLEQERYDYWGNLGDSYRWTEGLRDKAAAAYEKAISMVDATLAVTPADTTHRSRLALYLAKSGNKVRALTELSKVEQTPLSDKGTLFRAAVVYELAGDRVKALDKLRRAIAAGYSLHEIENEPELLGLRSDPGYASMARPAAATRKE